MKVADLYLDLSTKGAGDVGRQLTAVRSGFADLRSEALAAKAALLAAFYEVTKFLGNAAGADARLKMLGNLGLNTQALQQWQWALQQVNVDANETANSFVKLQTALFNIRAGRNVPTWWSYLSQETGINAAMAPEEIMSRLNVWAAANKSHATALGPILSEFLGSQNVASGLLAKILHPENTPSSQMDSKAVIAANAKLSAGLANLETKWQHFWAKLSAKHGIAVLDSLNQLSDTLQKIVVELDQISEKWKIFDHMGESFQNLKDAFSGNFGAIEQRQEETKPLWLNEKQRAMSKKFWNMFFDAITPSFGTKTLAPSSQSVTTGDVHVHTQSDNPHDHGAIVKEHLQRAGKALLKR